jgi:tRNA(Ile)-lysidine synthase
LTDLLQRVAATIGRYGMFRPGQSVGAAVSGGADSVGLLHALVLLAPRWELRLHVLHLNHKLRGEESDGDERFVREMAERLELPVMVQAWEWDGRPAPANLEEAGREARLAFFAQAMESSAVERVAVGHTRSDQAETVLFRFLRGAGTAGLAGIRPVTPGGIVRPLLDVDRAEVEAFLRERGILWREDSSNASPQFARNRIRHDLLPRLARDWNPSIGETLANTADWALAEEAYWEAEIGRLAEGLMQEKGQTTENDGLPRSVILDAEALRCLPVAAARRLVRHAMARVKGDLRGIDFGHIAAVMQMAAASEGHGRQQAPGLDIFRSFDWLRFARPGTDTLANRNYRFAAAVPGSIEIPGEGGAVHLKLVEITETSGALDYVYNGGAGGIDWERVSGPLELRNWRPGDRYRPLGRPAEDKIKTLFQEARIPLWERRHWPVLTDDSAIVWARRFGPAERYAAHAGTRVALAIRDTGGPEIMPHQERESGWSGTASIEV